MKRVTDGFGREGWRSERVPLVPVEAIPIAVWHRRNRDTSERRRRSAFGKGFGCRPNSSDRPGVRAGVQKPPKKEPAGERRAVGRPWDLTWQRVWRAMALPESLGAGRR